MEVKNSYRNHSIHGHSLEVRGGGFTAHTYVERFNRGAFESTLFLSGQVFPTSETALAAALQIGRYKIDTGFDSSLGVVQLP
jgi:hypothetical protein